MAAEAMANSTEHLVNMLRAAGDSTRIRLLLLLCEAELTVSELTQILGQSQPRVSRHLKLLGEAGLLERFKEGTWVFYRAAEREDSATLSRALVSLSDPDGDPVLLSDRRRLAEVRQARAAEAAAYFKANAPNWERLRSLHAPERDVEEAILDLLGSRNMESVLDAGTGTGRMMELLAPHIARGVGIDVSQEMLSIARDRLKDAPHIQLRLGDVYRLPFLEHSFDAVLYHQVLHYLDDPQAALREALRVLNPGGIVLIVDFAPPELEFLRVEHAHRRLGFSDREVKSWFDAVGLKSLAVKTLAHSAKSEKLTVKLWFAQGPGAARWAKSGRVKNVESAA
nr:MAG: metalloregulator ArsR/SmtB family transcription factor [Hyphomicrobiales bacterium]